MRQPSTEMKLLGAHFCSVDVGVAPESKPVYQDRRYISNQ